MISKDKLLFYFESPPPGIIQLNLRPAARKVLCLLLEQPELVVHNNDLSDILESECNRQYIHQIRRELVAKAVALQIDSSRSTGYSLRISKSN